MGQGKTTNTPKPFGNQHVTSSNRSDIFQDTQTLENGGVVSTSMNDFFISRFQECLTKSLETIDEKIHDEQRAAFLMELTRLRSETLINAIDKVKEFHYGGELYLAKEFTFMNFRRNIGRMDIILNCFNPTELTAGDMSLLCFYKTILNEGWQIVEKMTVHFPQQLTSWFGRLLIFFATLSKDEVGTRQQCPIVNEACDAPLGNISVRMKQARNLYYPTKLDFIRRRGIADTECGTESFGLNQPRNLTEGISPCVLQNDWMGAVLQEQSLLFDKDGNLRWEDSYSSKRSHELALLIRALFQKYMRVPVEETEKNILWNRIDLNTDNHVFQQSNIRTSFERNWENLSRFFKKEGLTSFYKNDEWVFPSDFPLTRIVSTGESSRLKSRDEERDLLFVVSREKMPSSTLIRRHVWKAKIYSCWPESNYGFTGVFPINIPLFNEYEYRT